MQPFSLLDKNIKGQTISNGLTQWSSYMVEGRMTASSKVIKNDTKKIVTENIRSVVYSHLLGQEDWYETDLKKQT